MAEVHIDLQSRCDALRSEIKEWERRFAAKNGSKPGRKDVKANRDVAQKYVEYENLRAKIAGQKSPHATRTETQQTPSRKRKSIDHAEQGTPKRRASTVMATPQKRSLSPSTEQLDGNVIKGTPQSLKRLMMMGPTPQKNGIPMGIFDTIPLDLLDATPNHARRILAEMNDNTNGLRTPSKIIPSTPDLDRAKFTRTPMSEGRRFLLDMFVTPAKREQDGQHQETPTTLEKQFQTPAFLRQYAQPHGGATDETPKYEKAVPWKRPQFGRSLSSMIQAMRKEEDDRLDNDLDILRELEQDDGTPRPPPMKKVVMFEDITPIKETNANDALDQDGFVPSDVEAEIGKINAAEAAEREKSGQPARVYKKKGLKRQTKRVNMRPVRQRPQNSTAQEEPEEVSDEDEKTEPDIIPETQRNDDLEDLDLEGIMNEEGEELNRPVEPVEEVDPEAQARAKRRKDAKAKLKKSAPAPKTATKKKAADHNNYRRLNIKNKNSKANGRRFGRRR